MYDYLIIGAGLFGSTFAHLAKTNGKKCLIIEKRNHIAGNIFSQKIENIDVHAYGPHIFNTNNKKVWEFINHFGELNDYKHIVKANYNNQILSLPFNMHTFQELWGCKTTEEAKSLLETKKIKIDNPQNLKEHALSMVGEEIYEKLIHGYTKKHWMCDPKELPSSIIKRIPIRFEFNNHYHNSIYNGIPKNGYTSIIENMLKETEVKLNVDFFEDRKNWEKIGKKIIYTGTIDRFFDYKYGKLEYRTLKFEHQILNCENFQNVAQMNYTCEKVKHTRIIEHKHFNLKPNEKTVITHEYPEIWKDNSEPYYPINTERNQKILELYKKEAKKLKNVIISGRLGNYVYVDMDQTIAMAMSLAKKELLCG